MNSLACDNGGVYSHLQDDEAWKLKEIMASYFVYLAAGNVPATENSLPNVRWVDQYEDGQGRGQMTAACSPFYNYLTDPPQLMGIICLGIAMDTLESFGDFTSVWADIKSDQEVCPDLSLTWAQLEILRAESPVGKSCEDFNDDGVNALIIALVIVGALGGCCCACVLIAKGRGERLRRNRKQKSGGGNTVAQAPRGQQQQQREQNIQMPPMQQQYAQPVNQQYNQQQQQQTAYAQPVQQYQQQPQYQQQDQQYSNDQNQQQLTQYDKPPVYAPS
jgi:hypothetical protein